MTEKIRDFPPQHNEINHNLTFSQLRQASLIAKAAAGTKVSVLAAQEGLSRSHVSTLLNKPHHKELFVEIYKTSQTELQNRLPGLVSKALDLLEDELTSGSSYDKSARIHAAIRLLELACKYRSQSSCSCQPIHTTNCHGGYRNEEI